MCARISNKSYLYILWHFKIKFSPLILIKTRDCQLFSIDSFLRWPNVENWATLIKIELSSLSSLIILIFQLKQLNIFLKTFKTIIRSFQAGVAVSQPQTVRPRKTIHLSTVKYLAALVEIKFLAEKRLKRWQLILMLLVFFIQFLLAYLAAAWIKLE